MNQKKPSKPKVNPIRALIVKLAGPYGKLYAAAASVITMAFSNDWLATPDVVILTIPLYFFSFAVTHELAFEAVIVLATVVLVYYTKEHPAFLKWLERKVGVDLNEDGEIG